MVKNSYIFKLLRTAISRMHIKESKRAIFTTVLNGLRYHVYSTLF